MIGCAREQDNLCYLELPNYNHEKPYGLVCKGSSTNREKLWLYHRRLGHASFRTLRVLFPSLFSGISVEDFKCETCEVAKHKRTSFLINFEQNTTPAI